MAESIVFGTATEILKKIGSLVGGELSLLWNLDSDLRRLQRTMSAIKAVLLDAETKQTQNHQLRDWLGKLKDVFYDAEDVLDEFDFQASRRSQRGSSTLKVSKYFSRSNPVKIRHKIKQIKERLDEIADDRRNFPFLLIESHVDVRHVIPKERETNSFFQASDVIGREEDKENIITFLMQPGDDNVSVIPIVGIGGLGKTTLSKMVYNDERVYRHFELKMWVCVSDDFDVTRLIKEIIYSAKHEDCAKLKADEIPERLQEILAGQKFLLVLDDVWNEKPMKWLDLRNLLRNGVNGSKIIVSTRSRIVAKIMGTVSPHVIEGLSLENSLSLFKKCAFKDGEEKDFPNLIKIAEDIVKKCKGVPLALRTLGSLLFTNTDENEWLRIKRSDIWQLKQEKEDILPVLKLSYDNLPSQLKQCFAYLSLFPKDYIYDSADVTGYWMAHGLLASSNDDIEELEDVAVRCLKDLWSRCFLEDFTEHNLLFYKFKMHDLAISVAKSDCAVVKSGSQIVDGSVRHFSITDSVVNHQKPPGVLYNRSETVRSVIFLKKYESIDESFIGTCIFKFKHLRLLSLNRILFYVLPKSVSTLIHLRYLDLSYNHLLKKLPESICKLQKLKTLRLFGSDGIKKLPKKIQRMISLRHVEITTKEWYLREDGIGCLSSLKFLTLSGCRNLVRLFEGMQGLTSLRRLVLQVCPLTSLPYSIKYLKRLETVMIIDCVNVNLKMEFQGEDKDNLCLGVRKFIISRLPSLVDLPQLILQGSANTLQCIMIQSCLNLVELPEWLPNLTSLQTLEILNCPMLSCLPEGVQRLTDLRQLKIQGCPALSESCRRDESKIAHVREVHLDE
ncbi:disease resistance protein RGA2-like [Pistacia vera]|uniref:disease resistance protein RGA2-like n=1 Tax=Pistacia vera TaxID=55513 RepID=UPI0012630938|nr:disease resistance protein RGA2-like [Pistacia vera]